MQNMTEGRRTATPTESGIDRIARREARRQESIAEARAAAKSSHKGHIPVEDRVREAAGRLEGTNVAQAIGIIREARDEEKDFLLLAEAAGKNRKNVMTSFPAPRRAVSEALLAAQTAEPTAGAGLGSPKEEEHTQ